MIVWIQWIGIAMIAAGAALTLITAIGMIRLGSLFSRMHASTKPQVLGLVLMVAGLAGVMQSPRVAATLALVVAMQLIVAPISAHMLARAVYRLRQTDSQVIWVDEYAEDLQRAERHLDAAERAGTAPDAGVSDGDPMPPPPTPLPSI